MKILVLDNYDSFTYNLVHAMEKISDAEVCVRRNDEIPVGFAGDFDRIVLSPGPGLPGEAGILNPLIRTFAGRKPILGVCLGLQAIGEVFGGRLKNLDRVFHGVATRAVIIKEDSLFRDLPSEIVVGRYHSWVLDPQFLPEELEITAVDELGNIMAVRHRSFNLKAVQFHPESVLTPCGEQIIRNWIYDLSS